MKRIADRLPLPHIREKVLYTMGRIALGNGNPSPAEQEIVTTFATAFNIVRERLDLIAAALKASNRRA